MLGLAPCAVLVAYLLYILYVYLLNPKSSSIPLLLLFGNRFVFYVLLTAPSAPLFFSKLIWVEFLSTCNQTSSDRPSGNESVWVGEAEVLSHTCSLAYRGRAGRAVQTASKWSLSQHSLPLSLFCADSFKGAGRWDPKRNGKTIRYPFSKSFL